jgi:4-hydroxy-4-methyl-2-oxoglutarate aldolase
MSAPIQLQRSIERPSADFVAHFRGVPSGFLADALGGRGALDHRIRALTSATTFVGTALPVWTMPGDNLAPFAALHVAEPGDVLVIANDGYETAAVVGDVLLGMARNGGLAAIVTDGMARDVEGMERTGLPIFARGLTPNMPVKNGPGRIGLPVSVGGAVVGAGDIVAGDRDGVVVVPRARIPEVLKELARVRARERDLDAQVAGGAKVPTWLPDYLARNPLIEVE